MGKGGNACVITCIWKVRGQFGSSLPPPSLPSTTWAFLGIEFRMSDLLTSTLITLRHLAGQSLFCNCHYIRYIW